MQKDPFAAIRRSEARHKLMALYEANHEAMERTALRILGSQIDAEDAMQNAFLQVLRHFEKTEEIPAARLPYWLLSIVKNEARLLLRKRKRTVPFAEVEEVEPMARCEARAESVTGYRELVELIRSMPETYRVVLELKLISGYTDAEIAERLGISKTAVSSRYSRGRAMLRKTLEEEGICP